MSHISKLIYRELMGLIPDLNVLKPFEKHDLKSYGYANIHLIVLEASREEMNIILSHYDNNKGSLISNPSVEIAVYPGKGTAEVVTYKDKNFNYHLFQDSDLDSEPDSLHANNYVNRLVYEWLKDLKLWNCNKRESISPLLLM